MGLDKQRWTKQITKQYFNIFKDFHNHYLKNDVFLLADVFEKLIFTCLKYYDLGPCHYFSAPGLS